MSARDRRCDAHLAVVRARRAVPGQAADVTVRSCSSPSPPFSECREEELLARRCRRGLRHTARSIRSCSPSRRPVSMKSQAIARFQLDDADEGRRLSSAGTATDRAPAAGEPANGFGDQIGDEGQRDQQPRVVGRLVDEEREREPEDEEAGRGQEHALVGPPADRPECRARRLRARAGSRSADPRTRGRVRVDEALVRDLVVERAQAPANVRLVPLRNACARAPSRRCFTGHPRRSSASNAAGSESLYPGTCRDLRLGDHDRTSPSGRSRRPRSSRPRGASAPESAP